MALNPTPADKRLIAAWLTRLAGVTRVSADNPLGADLINDYTEMLALDYPTGAFTPLSMRAVATGSEWFPAYDRIRREVGEWWSANKPAIAPALAAPVNDALSVEDRRALDSFTRRHDGPADQNRPNAPRGQALSMLHERFHGAWKQLMRSRDNQIAYEEYINGTNPPVRLKWNHLAESLAGAAEKNKTGNIVELQRIDRHAAD